MTLRTRLEALEQRQQSTGRGCPTAGFFLPSDPEEEIEPMVICNGCGREWRRMEGETANDFVARTKREAESKREGMLGFYDRFLRIAETA